MALRDELMKEFELRLGGGMVDVELDPAHYNVAIDKALGRYRQRSENAVEECFVEMQLTVDQSTYTLPDSIIEIKAIYTRTGSSLTSGGGNDIEPFGAQYLNTYLLSYGMGGGLATFDLLAQQREMLGRMFGSNYMYTWNHVTHTLNIQRRIKADDTVFLHAYKKREEEELFADVYASQWLKDYALAHCKLMLGEARSKFSTIAGPQGGTTLNGSEMKAEGQADIEKLEQDLVLFADGQEGFGFIIG